MKYITLLPYLGLKNDCPVNGPSLLQSTTSASDILLATLGETIESATVFTSYDVGGYNVDYNRVKHACSKAFGKQKWANSATALATKCLGLFDLWDGTNRNHIYFDKGKCYIYDGSRDPVVKEDVGSTTFATDDIDLYSIIQFGGYMIFADHAEHTPYKWKHGDANLTKLILSGTEYKFRYLMHLQNRIIGAYSDQTNGDIEIRFTDALPAFATLDFPALNQLYKPEGSDSITGLGKIGYDVGYIFSQKDITRLEYYSSETPVFAAYRIVKDCGSVNHHSIVSDGSALYFFSDQRGFVKFDGSEWGVISDNIEYTVGSIPTDYQNLIYGVYYPKTSEIVWAVPINNSTTPNVFLCYNTLTEQWRMENKAARCLDVWKAYSTYTWTDLILDTGDVWPTDRAWAHYSGGLTRLVHGNTDGYLYANTSEQDDGSDWESYRIEPILPLGDANVYHRLLEIWVEFSNKQNVDLDFYWRGGDTVAEVEHQPWASVGSVNMNSPDDPVVYLDKSARLHQVKWGTDAMDESYTVNGLRFGYVIQGNY